MIAYIVYPGLTTWAKSVTPFQGLHSSTQIEKNNLHFEHITFYGLRVGLRLCITIKQGWLLLSPLRLGSSNMFDYALLSSVVVYLSLYTNYPIDSIGWSLSITSINELNHFDPLSESYNLIY